jgi:hypothetical protein
MVSSLLGLIVQDLAAGRPLVGQARAKGFGSTASI